MMSPGATHNSHLGSNALLIGDRSARKPLDYRRGDFSNLSEASFLPARNAELPPNLRRLRSAPFLSRLDRNHLAHSLLLPSSVFVADDDDNREQVKWYAKSQSVGRMKW